MKVGFDLDGIFIEPPPFIPKRALSWLYRHSLYELLFGAHSLRELFEKEPIDKKLYYRYPSWKLERLIRILSHFSIFRPPIKQNINFLRSLSNTSHHFFLVTSRYQFLKSKTDCILAKYRLVDPFEKIYLNLKNQQPHLFKAEILQELNLDIFIDDDLELLKYLQKECPKLKLFWYNPNSKLETVEGIKVLKDFFEIKNYL